jgi:hypothetical protein
MMDAQEIAESIAKTISWIVISAIVILLGVGVFLNYEMTKTTNTNESKTKIKPDYRLETNGKKIDTVYIYKFKNK